MFFSERLTGVGLFVMLAMAPAYGGPAVELAVEAEDRLARGDILAAAESIAAAQDAVWAQLPLAARKVVVVESATGLGVYSPSSDAVYRGGEAMIVYVEPIGFDYGDDGLGNSTIALDFDVTVRTAEGEEVGTLKNIGQIRLASRVRNKELFVSLTISFDEGGLPAGAYRAHFLMKDANSEDTATFPVDFEIED